MLTPPAPSRADAHIHLFRSGFEDPHGLLPGGEDELASYQAHRTIHDVTLALTIGFEGDPRHRGNNEHIADLARDHRWIAPVAHLPLAPVPSIAELGRLGEQGFVGVAWWITDPADARQLAGWPPAVLKAIGEHFAVVSLNARAALIGDITGAVSRLEPATVLFSHLGLPGPALNHRTHRDTVELMAPLIALSAAGHVAVKASGYYDAHEPPHAYPHIGVHATVSELLEHFGPTRLLWGSDFSPALSWISFAQAVDPWLPPGLSAEELSGIRGGNLRRVLGHPTSTAQPG
jgi:predicted TIM-barrel fold metal-dependent hydrolase